MTENKRFTCNGVSIVDHAKKDLIYIGGNEKLLALGEYMDELQDENDQLRKKNNQLRKENSKLIVDCNGVNAEYEWFKKENKDLRQMVDFYKDFQKDARELGKENEELKQENQSLLKTVSHFDTVAGADRSYAERMDEENKQLKKENKHLNYRLNDLKHEIHHLKHEQKCLIKDISFLDMSAPQAKQAIKENEQLKQFKEKVFNLINTKIEECEKDYDRAVQAGMPSMIIYDEIESLEWLKKELKE